jgi:hypothetical protein
LIARPLLLAAALASLLALACAEDAPAAAGRPTAAAPQIDAAQRNLGGGTLSIALDPGQARDLDPIGLATSVGIKPPACADLVMSFTWQIQSPQNAEDLDVDFLGQSQDGTLEVASPAPHGSATVGCAVLQAVNVNKVAIVVQVRFSITSTRR